MSILDVRGHVDTVLVEPGVEKSSYLADYDAYLEGHIPVRFTTMYIVLKRSIPVGVKPEESPIK